MAIQSPHSAAHRRGSQSAVGGSAIIDTLPVPVCGWVRGIRDKRFSTEADYGCRAAKYLHYYGFKLGLRVSRIGIITCAALLPARAHDVNFTEELVDGFGQTILGDKGFLDPWRKRLTKPPCVRRQNLKRLGRNCYFENRRRYGSRRIQKALSKSGISIGRHQLRRLMREEKL